VSRLLLNRPLAVGDTDRPTDRPRWRALKPGEKENSSINNSVFDDSKNYMNVNENSNSQEENKKQEAYKPQYIWLNIISIGALHLVGLYATLLLYYMMPATILWGKLFFVNTQVIKWVLIRFFKQSRFSKNFWKFKRKSHETRKFVKNK
jgi:hypothetical protein